MTETNSIDHLTEEDHHLNENSHLSDNGNIKTNNNMSFRKDNFTTTQQLANTPSNNRTTSSIYNLLHSNSNSRNGSNLEEIHNNINNNASTNYEARMSPAPFISPSHSPSSLKYGTVTNGLPQTHIMPPIKSIPTTNSAFTQQNITTSPTTNDNINNNNNNNIPTTSLPSLIHSSPINMSRSFHNPLPLLNGNPSALNSIQYTATSGVNKRTTSTLSADNENKDTTKKPKNFNNNNSANINNNNIDHHEAKNYSVNKMKLKNNIVNRRNTQESIAKDIADKHIDKPITEYASIVRDAEFKLMNMDPSIISKSSIQQAEQVKERERQVFALLWLMKNCESKHDSYVPRGRIFAQYASSCAENKLKPLSQASLGKLIRTVFPDLTTRRLGMRGQSKYHYCGLKLINDTENDENNMGNEENNSVKLHQNHIPHPHPLHNLAFDVDLVKKDEKEQGMDYISSNKEPTTLPTPTPPDGHKKDETKYEEEELSKINLNVTYSHPVMSKETPIKLTRETSSNIKNLMGIKSNKSTNNNNDIFFAKDLFGKIYDNTEIKASNYKLNIPKIPMEKFHNNNSFDKDIVSSLESLYQVYCNTFFENVKFFNFDQLSQNLFSFNSGSISPQMYNLFISEESYSWIHECDLITHVAIVKYLSSLVLNHNDITEKTFDKLESFVSKYPEQVSKATVGLPVPIVTDKLEMAKNFTTLLKKLLKLLKFISGFLKSFESFRDGMDKDWHSIVNLEDILELVTTDPSQAEILKSIKENLKTRTSEFLKDEGPNPLYTLIVSNLKFISQIEAPGHEIVDAYTRFTNALIGDISLKSSENLLPWLFFNNTIIQLINYTLDVTIFVSQK